MLQTRSKFCVTAGFFKIIFAPKLGKWGKNRPDIGFFEFIEKFDDQFFLNLFNNKSLLYFLFLRKSHI